MADNRKTAIKVDHVSKTFRLPHERTTSIKSAFINFYRQNRTFEKQQALNDVSFEVKEGEFFGIVGSNGSGKSTLLKMLAGIYSPSKGSITINGKLTPFIELGVGFNHELSGRENVFLNGALLGFSRKEMTAMYDDIVAFAELERFMDQKLKNYSSGMQVRLAFSIAIRAESEILLLDEVLAVGDAAFQEKCFDYFGKIKRQNRTVIFVTHDMQSVSRFCDRALLIDKGNLKLIGDSAEIAQLYTKENFARMKDANEAETKKEQDVIIKGMTIKGRKSADQGGGIDLTLTVHSKITTKAVVGVSVLENMFYVGGVNSSVALPTYALHEGENHLDFTLDTGTLGAGSYNFGCTVFEAPSYKTLDQTVDGPKFQVTAPGSHKSGMANVDGKFSSR